jgi:cobyrinic acid a,c-diamide synthase
MAALSRRGMKVQPFKCGPDFIDPTLHRLVTGNISRNLDIRMCGRQFVARTFARHVRQADVAVIEGVMGLFDGGDGSAAALAAFLGVPVLLVVNAASAAESVAAVIKGFEEFDKGLEFAGVILNNIAGPRHEKLVRDAAAGRCRTEIAGVIPRDDGFVIPERHLGLFMGDERPISTESISRLAETAERYVDLDRVLRIGRILPDDSASGVRIHGIDRQTRVGVARDRAFCFYYEDNLDMFREAGAELVEFSVTHDPCLPDGLDAIYLGGGYPELYAEPISSNRSMLASLRKWAGQGRPMLAECGGFMLLSEGIILEDGGFREMAGVFPVRVRMNRRLRKLGYRQVRLARDSLIGRAGDILHGHEFHYSDISPMPGHVSRLFDSGEIEGWQIKNTIAGYMHFHFGRTPGAITRFLGAGARHDTTS